MSHIHLSRIILATSISLLLSTSLPAADETTTTTTRVVTPTGSSTTVEKRTIVSTPPQSVKCTTVDAHWDGTVWIDKQTVCNYANRSEGTAWVNDYWACTASTLDGTCTAWEYRAGHWIKTGT